MPRNFLSDFDYLLPSELIAQFPSKEREQSRLLHLDKSGKLHDKNFVDIFYLLNPNDLLIFNDTKVIKARLHAKKNTGGKAQILIENIIGTYNATARIQMGSSIKNGTILKVENSLDIVVISSSQGFFNLYFPKPVFECLETYGHIPLPPYIKRPANARDFVRYQTIYAREPGSIACPTAGLHFNESILERLRINGIKTGFVTLHVGSGTFLPVREEDVSKHVMHEESFSIPKSTMEAIYETKTLGGRVIGIGTTSVRAIESCAYHIQKKFSDPSKSLDSIVSSTKMFITPGYRYQIIDALITNFHLPKSTLLMLVSALAGTNMIKKAYAHAIEQRYRFLSYGDAMFIEDPTK